MIGLDLRQVDVRKPKAGQSSQIELSGLSGARVLLLRREDGMTFVRKMSADVHGNTRLQQQCVKQKLVSASLGESLTAPSIIDEGYDQTGRYYFDMEFIRGLDGVSYLRSASFPDVVRFTDRLRDCLSALSESFEPGLSIDMKAVTLAKCVDIKAGLRADETGAYNLLDRLISLIEGMELPPSLLTSLCHGDMTLENIVVRPSGQIVYIDLLDSFLSHWIADIAKLEQDLTGGWYMRNGTELPTSLVIYVRRALRAFAVERSGLAIEVIELLICVHLARILPYARTTFLKSFVLQRLEFFINRL